MAKNYEARLRKGRLIKEAIKEGIYNARLIPHEALNISYDEHLIQQILGELNQAGFEITRKRTRG